MFRVRWAWLGCGALLLHSLPVRAADPTPTSYALSWVRAEGAEECPTARALASEVERRLGRVVFDPAAARSFEVEVTRLGGKFQSDVFVRDESGRAIGHRTLRSDEPGCAALFSATALAIALVIDPEAASREPGASAVASFEAPPGPPPTPAPAPPAPAAIVTPPAPPAPPPPAPVAATPTTLSLRGQLSAGLLPAASPGVGLAFTARPGERFGFAVAAAYAAPQNVQQGLGDFEIGLTRASFALTFDVAHSPSFRFVVGLGPTLGALHVAVREPAPVTDPGDFLFAAAELGLDLQVTVSKAVFLELGGSGLVPLKRQTFSIRDQPEPVWSEPWVSGTLFVGLGTHFP